MDLKYKLSIGTAQFGLDYGINNSSGKISKEEIARILHYCHKESIIMLDTAQTYGDAELNIGSIIEHEKLQNRFKFITKLSTNSIDHIERSVKGSLERLQCQNIQGVLYHNFESFQNHAASILILEQMKKKGIIQKIGFSLYHPKQLDFLIDNKILFDVIQVPYNLFDRRFEPYFSQLNSNGIEVHVRSIFLQGLFLMELETLPPWFAKIRGKLQVILQLADSLKITLSSLCLNFGLLNKHIDKVIIGIDNLGQLKSNVASGKETDIVLSSYSDLLLMEEKDENIILPYLWKL